MDTLAFSFLFLGVGILEGFMFSGFFSTMQQLQIKRVFGGALKRLENWPQAITICNNNLKLLCYDG